MPESPDRRLDLRGLEPPQPLVRSLEAAGELAPGERLVLITDRRPVHLLPLLVERGYAFDLLALDDHHETVVSKPS